MTINTAQIPTNSSTATALIVQGSSTGQFLNITGNVTDQIPVLILNTDASITIYIGGSNVTSSNGLPLTAGSSIPLTLINAGDIPYAISASGTPKMAVLLGRQ